MYLRNCRKAGVEVSVTGAYTLYRGTYRGAHCTEVYGKQYMRLHRNTMEQAGTLHMGVLRYNATDMQIAELPLAMSHDRSSC